MAQVRIGHCLNDGEKKYLIGRRPIVQQCLQKNNIPCTLSKVPNIAILGSGGGERAMVGMLGSLYQMGEQGLLDAALYMIGVSGSTWCMASVYEKPNWSSDIEQIKITAERIGHDSVSIMDRVRLLIKYYQQNDNFSLTDAWAALVVPKVVKKIDESTLSQYQCHDKDPYPIYTVLDQDCKYEHLLCESFFELSPHETGYSLAGAFVETSNFGSIFNEGVLKTKKPEMDMTYLQGVCGSALADKEVILKTLKEWLENGDHMKALKNHEGVQLLNTVVDLQLCQYTGSDSTPLLQTANKLLTGNMGLDGRVFQFNLDVKNNTDQNKQIQRVTAATCQNLFNLYDDLREEEEELVVFLKTLDIVKEKPPNKRLEGASHDAYNEEVLKLIDKVKKAAEALQSHDGPRLILQTLELNYRILRGEDWTHLVDELNALLTAKKSVSGRDLRINQDEWVAAEPESRKKLALGLTWEICKSFSSWFQDLKNASWEFIVRQILKVIKWFLELCWIWGTNYNYLYKMNAPEVPQRLLKSETSHFEDAGLLVNSPYMSALRAEREIDLIISFDFSDGHPLETVSETAKECKDLGISFPEISYTETDVTSTKAFYVFNGTKKAPTVIHMPLFNVENCGGKLEQYRKKYHTFQEAYSPEMVEDLMEKAGENVINNKKNLLSVIELIVKNKL